MQLGFCEGFGLGCSEHLELFTQISDCSRYLDFLVNKKDIGLKLNCGSDSGFPVPGEPVVYFLQRSCKGLLKEYENGYKYLKGHQIPPLVILIEVRT